LLLLSDKEGLLLRSDTEGVVSSFRHKRGKEAREQKESKKFFPEGTGKIAKQLAVK
jgi:hypothetical protein